MEQKNLSGSHVDELAVLYEELRLKDAEIQRLENALGAMVTMHQRVRDEKTPYRPLFDRRVALAAAGVTFQLHKLGTHGELVAYLNGARVAACAIGMGARFKRQNFETVCGLFDILEALIVRM